MLGCGDDSGGSDASTGQGSESGPGTSGDVMTTDGTSSTATTSTTGVTTSGNETTSDVTGTGSTGTTGEVGDGNDGFDEAQAIRLGVDVLGNTLEPADTDEDYFSFTAQAGDLLFVQADGTSGGDPFSSAHPDVVLTLYDDGEQQVAQNDDPYRAPSGHNPELWYRAPVTGTYFIRVTDCLNAGLGGTKICSPADGITNHDYTLLASVLDEADSGLIEDAEGGDDNATSPNTIDYPVGLPGFFRAHAWGTFNDVTDVDVYAVDLPDDVEAYVTNAVYGTFGIYGPEGSDGIGTTRNVGLAWVEDDSGNVLARIDHSQTSPTQPHARAVRVPMAVDAQYWFYVQHPGGGAGTNDFYIFNHDATDSNPPESEPNDSIDAPATLVTQSNGELASAFIQGDQGVVSASDDYYRVDVPADLEQFSAVCAAQRVGSGLRALTITVYAGSDQSVLDTSGPEGETVDLSVSDIDVMGETFVVVGITSGTPSADVLSRFYECGFHFSSP
jgi:hypothetical protein